MKKTLKWLLPLAALVVLIALAGVLYNSLKDQVNLEDMVLGQVPTAAPMAETDPAEPPAATPTARPVNLAPDFSAQDQAGNEVSLSSFRGKPVVINFWASWCEPCKGEMPAFQKAWEQYGDQVQFMMVNLTDGDRETIELGKAFLEKEGYTFPAFFDLGAEAAIAYGIRSIPTSCFIGADGALVARINGGLSFATLERGLKMILP